MYTGHYYKKKKLNWIDKNNLYDVRFTILYIILYSAILHQQKIRRKIFKKKLA